MNNPPGALRHSLVTGTCLVAIAASALWIWRAQFSGAKQHLALHHSIGRIMAEETGRLMNSTGKVVLITIDEAGEPELKAQHDVRVVLRHECANSPSHRHGTAARVLTLSAQRTTSAEPDHIIPFVVTDTARETSALNVEPKSRSLILDDVSVAKAPPGFPTSNLVSAAFPPASADGQRADAHRSFDRPPPLIPSSPAWRVVLWAPPGRWAFRVARRVAISSREGPFAQVQTNPKAISPDERDASTACHHFFGRSSTDSRNRAPRPSACCRAPG